MSLLNEKHTLFLAVGPLCWGRGKTQKQAVKNCREHLSRLDADQIPDDHIAVRVYLTDEHTTIDCMGCIEWKESSGTPVMVGQYNKVGRELPIAQRVPEKKSA